MSVTSCIEGSLTSNSVLPFLFTLCYTHSSTLPLVHPQLSHTKDSNPHYSNLSSTTSGCYHHRYPQTIQDENKVSQKNQNMSIFSQIQDEISTKLMHKVLRSYERLCIRVSLMWRASRRRGIRIERRCMLFGRRVWTMEKEGRWMEVEYGGWSWIP